MRMFDRGDYYSVHGKDALFVAKSFYKTSTVIKYLAYTSLLLETVTITKSHCQTYFRDLLTVHSLRIEIWSHDLGKWKLARKASPGNIQAFDDLLGFSDLQASCTVIAVQIRTKADECIVGIAFTDASSGQVINMCQFVDDPTLANLESVIVQQNVKECIVSDSIAFTELEKLTLILEQCKVLRTMCSQADFKTSSAEVDLKRILRINQFKTENRKPFLK